MLRFLLGARIERKRNSGDPTSTFKRRRITASPREPRIDRFAAFFAMI